MTEPVPIVIPLHHGGGKSGNDLELRFALRSIDRHFKDPCRVVIVGRRLPEWLQGVEFIEQEKAGLKSALVLAANAFPDGFFWYYDDCCLMRDTSAGEMKVTPARHGWGKATTTWAKMLESIRKRLVKEGLPVRDYSRPHGPYWFDKAMIDEAFADWPKMKGKFPFESWILSKRDWPWCRAAVAQYYGKFRGAPSDGCRYLNYNDRGNTLELRDWLRGKFPEQSQFESTSEMSKKEVYALQARHLYGVWQEIGRPGLRSICECAVGPHALLEPFQGSCERALFIEPDPKMAAAARINYPWAEVHEVAITGETGTANLRKLNGASYVKGIPWAPAFDACPGRARRAGKVAIKTAPFSFVDDGKIDVLNLDCEGSEWKVLRDMTSRPLLIQIELYPANPDAAAMVRWFAANGYVEVKRWGNANRIYRRPVTSPA